jgi:hypothetical protein
MPLKPLRTKERLQEIKKHPRTAYLYAKYTLKAPWPLGESVIKKDPQIAALYAAYVLKRRWPEAEPMIKQKEVHWSLYKNLLFEFGITTNNKINE